jgi:DHA1 family bicyclomycin/chloramphenicol resistance-like MFS transporter
MPRSSPGRAGALLTLVLAGMSMLGPFSIDTPFPAFAQMRGDFGVGAEQMQLVVSAYMLAFAVMTPFHGPLSDAIGRKPVIIGALTAYAMASVGCALSPNLSVLLFFRVLQGLSAGGSTIIGRTIIRDLFDGPEAQRMMSRVMMIFGLAPAVAPIIGGLLLRVGPWPAIFWFIGGFALLLGAAVVAVIPETHPAERRRPLRLGPMLSDLWQVARSGEFERMSWAITVVFAGQFIYIGAAAIFVVDLLGKGEGDFWMFFVPMISGVIVGSGSAVARPVESAHADSSRWASPSRRQQPCWVSSSRWPSDPCSPGRSSGRASSRSGPGRPSRRSRLLCSTCSRACAARRRRSPA